MTTAFVLGGGGVLGATQVGMLKALLEGGITPDLVLGTSIGSINGAFVAADPTVHAVESLEALWTEVTRSGAFTDSPVRQAVRFAKYRTHLMSAVTLPRLLEEHLEVERIEDLSTPFQCVAAHVESAASHWFEEGPLGPAVAASCAVPGLFPAIDIDGAHYYDGGLVHSIPVGRAIDLGATEIYVLQVGRVEQALRPPRSPFEVGMVAFEIARRHRYVEEIATVPDRIDLHVLPSGAKNSPAIVTRGYGSSDKVARRIAQGYEASLDYLASQ